MTVGPIEIEIGIAIGIDWIGGLETRNWMFTAAALWEEARNDLSSGQRQHVGPLGHLA